MAKKNLTKRILLPKDDLVFKCSPGVECYTSCCGDVNIFLTPYDVIRMRKRLNLSSQQFLDKYTTILKGGNPIITLVILKMEESESKKCQLVTSEGCSVYEDRPWACRMFPLDIEIKGKYSFITDETRCKGLLREDTSTVKEWLLGQGVPEYEEWNSLYEEITGDEQLKQFDSENPKIRRMIFMATYDLDSFRRFVFESSFLDKFDLDEQRIEKVKNDESELLKLGFDWIKFGLFAEKTLKLKGEVLEAKRNEMTEPDHPSKTGAGETRG